MSSQKQGRGELQENHVVSRDSTNKQDENANVASKPQHPAFSDILSQAGIPFNGTLKSDHIMSKPPGPGPVAAWSWTLDNKVIIVEPSDTANDLGSMKANWTELSMAILMNGGVDFKSVQAIGRPHITNMSTLKTIDSIFKHVGEAGPIVRLARVATGNRYEAFDAFFRTRDGVSTLELLTEYAGYWGYRNVKEVIVRRDGGDGEGTNAAVILE